MDIPIDFCKTCFHERTEHHPLVEGSACDGRGEHCGCQEYVHGETRVTSATGAEKGTKEARYDLIPIPALDALARLYGKGAEKYSEHNWRLGYKWSLSYSAAQRHMNAFWSGEDLDPETQVPHVINAAFHMFALATFLTEHPELDDRFETNQGAPHQLSFTELVQAAIDVMPSIPEEALFREKRLEETAQWLSTQKEGTSIAFDPSFTDEEVESIFTRARKLEEMRKSSDEEE